MPLKHGHVWLNAKLFFDGEAAIIATSIRTKRNVTLRHKEPLLVNFIVLGRRGEEEQKSHGKAAAGDPPSFF